MKKLLPCLLFFFLLLIPIESKNPAFADDRVTIKYYFKEELLLSQPALIGSNVSSLSYATVKSSLKGREVDLTPGTLYEWRIGSPLGEKTEGFVASADTDLYYVPVATGEKRFVTYRYDYLDENHFLSETIEYPFGAEYSVPEKINELPIRPILYKTPDYGLTPNNELHKPTYLLSDLTVYVATQADAVYTVDGVSRHSAYGQKPEVLTKKDHEAVGFFTDPDCTAPYNGPAVNGLTLYVLWQKTSYTVTISTEKETTELTLPINDPVLKEKVLPDGYEWTIDSEKITLPYAVDGDVTITGTDPKQVAVSGQSELQKKSISKDEIIAVSIIGVAFVAVGAYSLAHFLINKKKKQTKSKKSDQNES